MLLLCCLLGFGLAPTAQATHFRYGDMSWRVVQSDATGHTIEFKVSAGWALTTTSAISINFGDGTTAGTVPITYTNINGVYQYGTGTLVHRYVNTGSFKAVYSGGNKISSLQNNANGLWYVSSVVNVGGGNSSPVATVPAVVNVPLGLATAKFIVPAADPDGRPLSFRLASGSGDWSGTQPAGISINSQSGEVTFNTVGKTAGQLYNTAVVISNGRTEVLVDFIMQVVAASNPPQFDYAVTPANQRVFNVSPGQPVSFTVKATSIDAGSSVRLSAVGVPSNAVVSPAFGVFANPVQHTFSWTPTASQFGTFVVNFTAENNVGAQTATSVSIIVSLKPRFDVPPTPAAGTDLVLTPGVSFSHPVQASVADPSDQATIISVQEKLSNGTLVALPAGAALGQQPSTAGNPTSTTFSWTPAPSNWGEHTFVFTASETHNEQITHELNYVVNNLPVFTSAPVTRADVGQLYTYTISTSDADLAYGDAVDISETLQLPSWLTLTANPATGTAVLSGTPPASAAGTLVVRLQAEDAFHHSYASVPEQTFTITINNCTVQAVAQDVSAVLDANGQATVSESQVNNGSTASCGIAAMTVSPATFTCANVGPNPVTLTVTDANGNVSTATAVVTVQDNELPTITAPVAVTVSTDAGQCSATNVALGTPATADNCSNLTTTNDAPTAFAKGVTTVTWTVTDASGNKATATQTVTVNDTEAPTISTPVSLIVSTDAGQCSATGLTLGTPTAGDNCTGVVVRNDAPATFPKGTTTVTWTATDAAGLIATATQTVTVNDTEAPTISAPATVSQSADRGQCTASSVALGNAVAGDNCTGVTVTNNAPATFPKGTTTVTWTATDAAGLTATATQTVTILDVENPTISAPAAVSVSTNPGQCSATGVALGNAIAADNCSAVTVTNNAPTTFAKGATTVTWTATDASGNVATATQTVTVNDTEAPVLTVPAAIVRSAPASQCGAVVTFATTAADNCAGATVVASPASGSTFAVGTTTVRLTATDASGNTSTDSFSVTVNDATAPTVAVRNVTVTLVNGAASVTAADVNNGSTDACGIATLVLNKASFSCANLGNNPVTLTVTDIHGNVASAPAVVTVVGSIPAPAIAVAPASNVYTGGVATNLYLGYGSQSATLTATGGVSYAWSPAAGLSSTKLANPVFTATTAGTFTYTVTATNQYGCTATATVTLRVVDARCDKDKVVVCHNGHEICISPNAVPAHLTGHAGDQLGACTTAARGTAPAVAATSGSINELSAYPNPANDQATVSFRTPLDGKASVVVYDGMGRRVASLYDGAVNGGQLYSLTLNSQNLAAGLYQCQLVVNGKAEMLRLLIAR
ncbi:hypothetical protein GCM10028824_36390 [Hymenobacter segetis]